MLDGESAADAVAAPRAIVGRQALGCTKDSVVVEADIDTEAVASVRASSLEIVEMPRHSEDLGQTNVVSVDPRGQLTAAADPRADGSAVVVQYARHDRKA